MGLGLCIYLLYGKKHSTQRQKKEAGVWKDYFPPNPHPRSWKTIFGYGPACEQAELEMDQAVVATTTTAASTAGGAITISGVPPGVTINVTINSPLQASSSENDPSSPANRFDVSKPIQSDGQLRDEPASPVAASAPTTTTKTSPAKQSRTRPSARLRDQDEDDEPTNVNFPADEPSRSRKHQPSKVESSNAVTIHTDPLPRPE
jgi:hypothetical protein